MKLPDILTVAVRQREGPIAGALVWLTLRIQGRDYYSTNIGLTDAQGRVAITGSALEDMFRQDQRVFPMDYKVALQNCDNEVAIGVDGGHAFSENQGAALRSALTSPEAKRLWSLARNAQLRSAKTLVVVDVSAPTLMAVLDLAS